MDEIKSFSVNLKKLREQNNITQKELAEKIGVTSATISAYENMSKRPSLDVALGIAHALGVSIDELCNRGPMQVTTFDQFILYFTELVKSGALCLDEEHVPASPESGSFYAIECLNIHPKFKEFAEGFRQIYRLYEQGTIPQKLLDLWIKDEMEKYQQVDIREAIASRQPDPPSHSKDYVEITKDEDLPF